MLPISLIGIVVYTRSSATAEGPRDALCQLKWGDQWGGF